MSHCDHFSGVFCTWHRWVPNAREKGEISFPPLSVAFCSREATSFSACSAAAANFRALPFCCTANMTLGRSGALDRMKFLDLDDSETCGIPSVLWNLQLGSRVEKFSRLALLCWF